MRKKSILLALGLLAAALLLGACAARQPEAAPQAADAPATQSGAAGTGAPKAEYRKLSAEEAKARMDSGDPLTVLDVREESEYAAGHIPGALLLPLGQTEASAAETLPDRKAEILLYCRSGNRSRQAAMKLIELGYTNVYDFGGIIDWPYETVREP